jgi:hypothetical protein
LWRTGEGEAGKWGIVADPTAVNGRAIAQVSKDRTDRERKRRLAYKSI